MPVFDAVDMNPGLQGASSVSNVPFESKSVVRKGRVAEMLKNFIYTYKKPLLWTFGILAFIGFIALAVNDTDDSGKEKIGERWNHLREVVNNTDASSRKKIAIEQVLTEHTAEMSNIYENEDDVMEVLEAWEASVRRIEKINVSKCPNDFVAVYNRLRNKMRASLRLISADNLSKEVAGMLLLGILGGALDMSKETNKVLEDRAAFLEARFTQITKGIDEAYQEVLDVAKKYGVNTQMFERK
jgi:hypothetical protein